MINLKTTDGTDPHLRAIQEHGWRCRQKNTELVFQTLQNEAERLYVQLKGKAREAEDSYDESSNLRNDMDGAELLFEKEARNAHGLISSLERDQPQLGVLLKIFPKGLDGVLKPERGKQLAPGQQLLDRMEPFLSYPAVQSSFDKVYSALQVMEKALDAWEKSLRIYQKIFGQERELRTSVREQIVDAKARLTQFYKSAPEQIEKFFLNDPHVSSTALYRAEQQGRIGAKLEVLLSFLTAKQLEITAVQRETLDAVQEEATIELWLSRAFAGAVLVDEILATPPITE
jgi:hypothetical protein